MSDATTELLKKIASAWPEPMTIAPEPPELMELRRTGFVEQWDMHPNGDRRWMATVAGLAAVHEQGGRSMPTTKEIDAAAHVLYDQDTYRPNAPPVTPLLSSGDAATIERYRGRAREILEAAERVRLS